MADDEKTSEKDLALARSAGRDGMSAGLFANAEERDANEQGQTERRLVEAAEKAAEKKSD